MCQSGVAAAMLLAHSVAFHCGVNAAMLSPGFLILSAPRNAKVSWVRLPEDGSFEGKQLAPKTLVDVGLKHPQGVAIDQKRKRLFVADPDVQKIFAYTLHVHGDSLTTDGTQTVIASNTESRWVAVDGRGNVFFSNEPQNQILKVAAEKVLRGDPVAEVVYDGSSLMEVDEPGGIAVDNFHVYWTNKHFGTRAGSVVKGSEAPIIANDAETVSILARNAVKSYGICLALGNVYYTNSEKFLYGVKRGGGRIQEVSAKLQRPRGCVWDGDGTVYVADRGANAVFSFAGNMHTLQATEIKKAFDFEDAFGLGVLVSGAAMFQAIPIVCPILLAFMFELIVQCAA